MYYYLVQSNQFKYSTMRYTYDIINHRGEVIERDLNTEDEAFEYLSVHQSQGHDTSLYQIIKVQHYTVKGLGRDPDLH